MYGPTLSSIQQILQKVSLSKMGHNDFGEVEHSLEIKILFVYK